MATKMGSKELDNLVKLGTLKTEVPDSKEFEGLVASGRAKLTDAAKNDLSPESKFDLAYNAAHALSLAAMRWHGYRPNKFRFVVFQALPHTLGLDVGVWRVLDKSHNIRNTAEYEGHFNVDDQLLEELLKATDVVLNTLENV